MNPKHKVEFSLLENGFNFILSALSHLEGEISYSDLKYAVLHLGAGIELVLKQRLENENWKLLYRDIKKANWADFETGNFISVNLDDCLFRLKTEVGIEFDDKQVNAFDRLRRMRNKMQHFKFDVNPEAIIEMSIQAVSGMLDFIGSEMSTHNFSQKEKNMAREIRQNLNGCKEFSHKRSQTIENTLFQVTQRGKLIITCPICLQDALVIGDSRDAEEGAHCYFCRYWESDSRKTANEFLTNVLNLSRDYFEKNGEIWPKYHCPSCMVESLVNDSEEYICFNCGLTWEAEDLNACEFCQRHTEDTVEELLSRGGRCRDCFEEMIRADNT